MPGFVSVLEHSQQYPLSFTHRQLSLLTHTHNYPSPSGHLALRSYFIYSCGTCTTYSNIRCFRDDLLKYPPDYFV